MAGRKPLPEIDKLMRKGKMLLLKIEEFEELKIADPDARANYDGKGRPPVPYQTRINRAKNELDLVKTRAREILDSEGKPSRNIFHQMRNFEDKYANVGRRGRSEVAEIEYKIRQKEQRIKRISEGKEDVSDELKTTSNGKIYGRKPRPSKDKIEKLESEIVSLKKKVKSKYKTVTAFDKRKIDLERSRVESFNKMKEVKDQNLMDQLNKAKNNLDNLDNLDGYDQLVIDAIKLEEVVREKDAENNG